MEVTSVMENGTLTVSVIGRVDTNTTADLDRYLEEHLDGVEALVFDLKDMKYTSSAGLRLFLKTQKRMNKQGSMKLINVQNDVMEIFDMTGFSSILTIE